MKKKNVKVPFVVVMSFSRRSKAEIARHTISDNEILGNTLLREKSKFEDSDFLFFDFVDDDSKVYRVIFQVLMKDKEGKKKRLFSELKIMFDCSDIEIVQKQDFDFTKYNLQTALLKSENRVDNSQQMMENRIDASTNRIANVTNERYISNSLEAENRQNNLLQNELKKENQQNNFVPPSASSYQGFSETNNNQSNKSNFDDNESKQQDVKYNRDNPFE